MPDLTRRAARGLLLALLGAKAVPAQGVIRIRDLYAKGAEFSELAKGLDGGRARLAEGACEEV